MEFPEEADAIATVAGNERLLAVRFAGGGMVYITPSQLLEGLVKSNNIKTINGSSLVGTGNITVATGSAETKETILNKIGILPLENLPEAILSNEQFEVLPDGQIGILLSYLQSLNLGGAGQTSAEDYLKALPGWGVDKLLQGNLTWVDPPTGEQLEKLSAPVFSHGNPASDAMQLYWEVVPNGITYTIERDNTLSFENAITVYVGSGLSYLDSGLIASTSYKWRIKVSATGFFSSNWTILEATTDIPGNATPAAPVVTGNDTANTLIASHTLGISEILVSENEGAYIAYTGSINVGNVARPVGYCKFKIKAAAGRNESPVANSPAFTVTLANPVAPMGGTVNNETREWTIILVSGYTASQHETSVDNGVTWVTNTSNVFIVGNDAYPIGHVKSRVKESATNNSGVVLSSKSAFTAYIPPVSGTPVYLTAPVESVNQIWNESDHSITNVELGGNACRSRFAEHILAGTDGAIQAKVAGINMLLSSTNDFYTPQYSFERNIVNNKVQFKIVATSTYVTLNNSVTGDIIFRVSFVGSIILFQYSINNGLTFIGDKTTARPVGIDYWLITDDWTLTSGGKISEIKGVGLVI